MEGVTLRILVTNDDGIDAPGLLALARCVADAGFEAVIAAPATEASGTSAGLTAAKDDRRTVAVERRTLPGIPEAYAVAATPGLIALIACRGGFGPRPDAVFSGVNLGANVGRAVLHSGTVGAALTASINGVSALAVSLDVSLDDRADPHWSTATAFVTDLITTVADSAAGTAFTLNVPDVPLAEAGALRWVRLATYGRVQASVTELRDGVIEVGSVVVEGELEPGTDADMLARGHATITPLRSVSEATELLPPG